MAATASYNAGSGAISINQSSGYSQSFSVVNGSDSANRSGATQRDSSMVQMLNADNTPCLNGVPSFLKLSNKDGSFQKFSVDSGKVDSMGTAKGVLMSKGSYDAQVRVEKDAFGQISRIESDRDGIMEFERTATKLTISQFSREQMIARRARGAGMAMAPVKTYGYEWNHASQTMNIVNQEAGREPVYIERKMEGNKVIITKGLGDDRVVTTYERNYLPGNKWEEIKTIKGINDTEPTSSVRTVKQSTGGGWLTLSETKGYGTSLAQTTTYTYNSQYRVSLELKPNGGYTQYEYDSMGRVVMEASPWTAGEFLKVIRTTYADLRFNDYRPSQVRVVLKSKSGQETEVKRTEYAYVDSPQVNRKTVSTFIPGAASPLVTVEEICGEAAANDYSRGRTKMTQDEQGIQQIITYENTSDHGACWKVTTETQAHGAIISGQSRRNVEYRAVDETVVRKEEYVHTENGWSLISSSDHEYDGQKRRIKTTRGNGRVSTTKWGCCGPLEEVDEDGVKLSYGYNSSRHLVEVIRSATETTPETITSYKRNAEGRVLEKREDTGARTRSISMNYDILGRTIQEKDLLGRVTTTRYENRGLKKTVTLPAGAQEVTEYNWDETLKYELTAGKLPVSFRYSIEDNCCMIERTAHRGTDEAVTGYTLTDWSDRLLQTYEPSVTAGMPAQMIESKGYNAKGQTAVLTERGVKNLCEYDSLGNVIKKTLPMTDNPTPQNSLVVSYAYSYEKQTDGVYHVTAETSYDAEGNPVTRSQRVLVSDLSATLAAKTIETDIYGKITTEWTEYAGATKRVIKRTIPSSNVMMEVRLTDGVTVYSKNSAGVEKQQSLTYMADGHILTTTDGRGNSFSTKRDIAERIIAETDGNGNQSTKTYDLLTGKLACVTDRNGQKTHYKYDSFGRLIAQYGTGTRPALKGYDEESNQISLTTFRGSGTVISDDPSGRTDGDTTTCEYSWPGNFVLRKTYADGSFGSVEYGNMNRLRKVTNARGQTAEYTYHSLTGNILSVQYSDSATPDVRYTYNHLSWLTGVADGSGSRSFDYDHYGNSVQDNLSINGNPYILQSGYDTLGRFVSQYMKKEDNTRLFSWSQTYGMDGRIDSVAPYVNGAASVFRFGYLPGSNLLKTLSMPCNVTKEINYEENRDLETGFRLTDSWGNIEVSRTYQRDAEARFTGRTQERWGRTREEDSFDYNDRSELDRARIGNEDYQYNYDNSGNRTLKSGHGAICEYEASALNQYSVIDPFNTPFTPTYDTDGNQTKVKTSTGIWNVTYNTENRPIRFTSENGQTTVECGYDYQGRRHSKKVTKNGTVMLHESYVYNGYLQLAALDMRNGGNLLHFLLWDPLNRRATRTLAVIKDEMIYCCIHDQGKNVTELLDNHGKITATYDYSPYGEVTADQTVNSPVQWSNEVYDEELGLVYYNYRHYNPTDGRWISRDPIGEQDDFNLYAFVSNKMEIDYLGLEEEPGDSNIPDCFQKKKPEPKTKVTGNKDGAKVTHTSGGEESKENKTETSTGVTNNGDGTGEVESSGYPTEEIEVTAGASGDTRGNVNVYAKVEFQITERVKAMAKIAEALNTSGTGQRSTMTGTAGLEVKLSENWSAGVDGSMSTDKTELKGTAAVKYSF